MNTLSPDELSSIGSELTQLGVLIGIISRNSDGSIVFNPDWFSDPSDKIKNSFNWENLQPVAESFLGQANNPIEAMGGDATNECWFPLSIDDGDGGSKNSGFYVVEKTVGTTAFIGIGIHHEFEFTVGGQTVTLNPYAFIPVFDMSAGNKTMLQSGFELVGPVEIGLGLIYTGTFSKLYNGLLFTASFDFSNPATLAPTLTLLLSEPKKGFVPVPNINKTDIFNALLTLDPIVAFLKTKVLPNSAPVQFTWGTFFNAIGWLKNDAAPYQVGDISIVAAPGKLKEYVTSLITKAFTKFLGTNDVVTLVSNMSSANNNNDDEADNDEPTWSIGLAIKDNRYGINVQVKDICIKSDSPYVKLQVGALTADETDWMTEASNAGEEEATGDAENANNTEEKDDDTEARSLGINFFILSGTPQTGIRFDPQFEAISIGFDISQTDDQPLFDIKGYSIKQAQLRGYFSTLQGDGFAWGVAAAVNNVALPLGPASTGDGGSVAQTLLSSADKPDNEADTKPVVNPEFSFLAAYLNSFYFQLFDADGQPTEIVTIPIQKSFGPVALRDVGIGWKGSPDYQLLFQLDGGLNLSALKLNLDKLTIGIPVTTPGETSNYSLGLEGFDLSFTSSAVSLNGGFLKYENEECVAEYNGAVAIQAGKWGITALGSFASVQGSPSLFIFGVLNAALGGPPVFFVTALAVGFGYNRKIIMPAIDQVQNFPFVQAAVNPNLFGGDTNGILASISKYIPPQLGQYWFAAGVKFSSFEILNSFALLVLQFGNKTEIDVLGLSTLQLPKQNGDKSIKTYVNAQMALKASFQPEEGILAVQGQLTNNSYVIDPACKISGGFAYYSWFKGDHAGDFVVTLGGYNKNFKVPSHYPTVPRLAFNWKVDSKITFSGEAYFALTPSCVMAGGKMSLTYSDGDLQAWFKAFADFLIMWKPFHYDVHMGISVGVSYRVNLLFISKTITVELGVDVHLWGPEFGGEARVSLWIISFTIGFGAGNTAPNKDIEWGDFQKYFLPANDAKPKADLLRGLNADPAAPAKNVTINVNSGLKEKYTDANKTEYLVVDPGTFSFNTESAIPVTKIAFAPGPNGSGDTQAPIAGNPFGIKPVGQMTLKGSASTQTIKLTKASDKANGSYQSQSLASWNAEPDVKNVPKALWSTTKGDEKPDGDNMTVPQITSGLNRLKPSAPGLTGPQQFPASNLAFTTVVKSPLPLNANGQLRQVTLNYKGSLDQIKNIATGAKTQRDNIFAALTDIGTLATSNNSLSVMALAPQNIFQGSPMLANTNAKPLLMATKMLHETPIFKLRNNAPLPGHQLKATLIKYKFDQQKNGGSVLRGGKFNTTESKSFNTVKADKANSGFTMLSLSPGMMQIWDLSPYQNNDRLRHNGSLPLRMILFDKNLEIVDDSVVRNGKAGYLNINHQASKMCLQALDPEDINTTLSGWHEGSQLSLVNPKYLVGKGCMVRSRTPVFVGSKQIKHDTGLVNGRTVVLKNRDSTAEGKLVKGWVDTRFASGIKQVFVLAREEWSRGEAENTTLKFSMNVRLIYTDEEGTLLGQTLIPVSTGINNNELWAGFTIPQGLNHDTHFSIWVETETDDKIQLAGVAGCEDVVDSWTEELTDQLAGHEAALHSENIKLRTSVGLQNHLNF